MDSIMAERQVKVFLSRSTTLQVVRVRLAMLLLIARRPGQRSFS